jgi:hypothetical protein
MTRTPTYAVRLHVPGFAYTPMGWDCKRAGRPTEANLAAYVASFERSTQPGGVNAHLGAQKVKRAWITRQATGERVAEVQA